MNQPPSIPEHISPDEPTGPSSRSARLLAAAQRNPVAAAASVGTGAVVGVTGLIELLQALNKIGGGGIVWQVASFAVALLWTAASYAMWQGRLAEQRQGASQAEADRIREIYQDAANRQERREEQTIAVIQEAIVELKNGQAATNKALADLTTEVRAFFAGQPTQPPHPPRGASPRLAREVADLVEAGRQER